MASHIARFAICADGTAAKVILVPAAEHKCVHSFGGAFRDQAESDQDIAYLIAACDS
jgi:hypothetical protein